MGYWNDWSNYKPRIKAKGGIRAQSKRGSFGETWWGKRWVATLESFDIGARMGRGRSYARNGSVLAIDIASGEVKAKVQGSYPQPYKISIKLKAMPDSDWRKLAKALSTQAIFAAKLLAGEMPPEIEDVFKAADLALFPAKSGDLHTDCSCPDWSNPCKHIAAVYYLIGEEFDRDPFLLFKLRGMERAAFTKLLGAATPAAAAEEAVLARPPEPLNATTFWQAAPLPPDWLGEARTPPVNAAVLQRLGNFPFWRGSETLAEALTPVYVAASARGLEVFVGSERAVEPRAA
ncbi:MAG: SWIM zinc finger family protein [Acidobacteria bacterium]|nr:SWIM zinc finger family protein [Acidobacteriota bacterium]MBI3421595.1 SWIM zinc finger family protein [Acidobacteriota bacterium]